METRMNLTSHLGILALAIALSAPVFAQDTTKSPGGQTDSQPGAQSPPNEPATPPENQPGPDQPGTDTTMSKQEGDYQDRDNLAALKKCDSKNGAARQRCIDAAGDFGLRDHEFAPGSRVFSTRVNELICGDVPDASVNLVPKDSIAGVLRNRLDTRAYTDADFPALSEVFEQYAASVGNPADWGKVPLSVEGEHLPLVLPLRVGYETRFHVDEILYPIREDKARCLRIATESLAEILKMVASAIDHRLALTLAIETMNGISKTASMTEKAMQHAQKSSTSKAR
jgi:hypothetical protein